MILVRCLRYHLKRVVKADEVVIQGEQLTINTHGGRYGCFLEILERTKDQMDAMLSYHSRVLVVLIQLTPSHHTEDNKEMSSFLRKLRKKLSASHKISRMGFLWVREWDTDKGKTDRQHYHLALVLDANRVIYPARVLEEAERIWRYWGHPKTSVPKNCYYLVHRGDPEAYKAAFERLSYLAKTRTKGNKAKDTNDYSTSRIKLRGS